MNYIKYTLLFVLLFCVGTAFAQLAQVNFKDASGSALTKAAIDLECVPLLGGAYTTSFPTSANRWRFQWYKDGGDGIISPLDSNGNPTGDDAIAVGNGGVSGFTQGVVSLSPGSLVWAPSAAPFAATGAAPINTFFGSRVFMRIFNANTIAAATKSMAFTALYTIPSASGTYVIQPYIPSYAWGPWVNHKLFAPNPATNGFPTSTTLGWANPVTLSWNASVGDGSHSAATGYDVYFGTTLPGTPNSANQAGLTYDAGSVVANTTYYCKVIAKNSAGSATPLEWSFQTRSITDAGPATNPSPANGADFNVVAFPYSQTVSWTAPAGSLTGYKFYWNGAGAPVLLGATTTSQDISIPVAGTYTWQVIPYYTDPGTKSVRNGTPIQVRVNNVNTPKGDATGCPVWSFTVGLQAVPDIPAGDNADVGGGPAAGGANIAPTGVDLYNGPAILPNDPVLLVLHNLANVTDPIILSYTGTGIGVLTVTVGPGRWWGLIHDADGWVFADVPMVHPLVVLPGNTGIFIFHGVNFGAKGGAIIVLGEGENPLPVELSSFTATLTSQYFINLTWVTESETSVLGYNVYRSDSNNYANAQLITPVVIPATNTSQQQSYTMTDSEALESNHTYYYWLENVDMGGTSNLHGPISATVTGQPVTPLPEISAMSSAYPNPFRMGSSTTIDVNIKAGEKGTVTVYNILGQAVKTFNVTQGSHQLTWNAKDCASGIYFYKLSTPTMNTTKKLVIVN